jgi:hypothetical protein
MLEEAFEFQMQIQGAINCVEEALNIMSKHG